MKFVLLLVLVPLTFSVTQSAATAQGVSAPWDISQTVKDLGAQAQRLTPILDQLTPEQWKAKGAPDAYVGQWQAAKNELGYLLNAAEKLSKQPERLPLALETYFRLQALEMQLNSLIEGVRRYQNPAVGDLLIGVMAANSGNRDQLRQYISDLAETRDQELKVIDEEAQRCRGTLLRQPASRSATRPAAAAGAASTAPAPPLVTPKGANAGAPSQVSPAAAQSPKPAAGSK